MELSRSPSTGWLVSIGEIGQSEHTLRDVRTFEHSIRFDTLHQLTKQHPVMLMVYLGFPYSSQ